MAEIARGTHLPIATGERVFTKWGFREVLEKRAATILQPDLCHAGGITEVPADRRHGRGVLRRHRAAQPARGPSRWPPASRWPRRFPISSPGAGQPRRGLSEEAVRGAKGYLDLPTGPGLGIELDEKALADKIGHDWRNREAYDEDDGSVVDW